MKVSVGHLLMPQLALLVGAALLYAGIWGGWGAAWVAGGAFFISIGLAANLLTLAWILPGPVGAFLRHPVTNIFILAMVLISLCLTVTLGIFGR
jgi:hypothetical protein